MLQQKHTSCLCNNNSIICFQYILQQLESERWALDHSQKIYIRRRSKKPFTAFPFCIVAHLSWGGKSNNSSNIFRICLWSGVCSLKNGIVHLLFMPSKTVKYGKSNMMLLQHMSMRAPDFYYRNIFYDAISYFCNKISLILRIWLQNCI